MMYPPSDDLMYSFKYQILPPMYLTETGIIVGGGGGGGCEPLLSKELIAVEPVKDYKQQQQQPQQPEQEADDATNVCGSLALVSCQNDSSCLSTCSSRSTSSSSRSSDGGSRRRRVAFVQDEAGQMIVTHHAADVNVLTPEDCEVMWYRSSEFKYFRKYCKKLATIAAASKYGKDFVKTYKACGKTESQPNLEKYSKIANSSARGMEALVNPQMVKDRKDAIRSIIKAQSKFPDDMPWSERTTVLCATSRVLSRQSRMLARLLGTGDANVVAKAEEEEAAAAAAAAAASINNTNDDEEPPLTSGEF